MAVTTHDQVDLWNGCGECGVVRHPEVREHNEQIGLLPQDWGVLPCHVQRIEKLQITSRLVAHPDAAESQNGYSDAADLLNGVRGEQPCAGFLVRHVGVQHREAHVRRLFDEVIDAEVEVAVPGCECVHPNHFEDFEVRTAAGVGRDQISSCEKVSSVQYQDALRIQPADITNERCCVRSPPILDRVWAQKGLEARVGVVEVEHDEVYGVLTASRRRPEQERRCQEQDGPSPFAAHTYLLSVGIGICLPRCQVCLTHMAVSSGLCESRGTVQEFVRPGAD